MPKVNMAAGLYWSVEVEVTKGEMQGLAWPGFQRIFLAKSGKRQLPDSQATAGKRSKMPKY